MSLPRLRGSVYCRAGMTPEQIAEVRPRLLAFYGEMLGGLARSDQRAVGELYVRGSGNIADHYTHIDDEMITEMLADTMNSCMVHDRW